MQTCLFIVDVLCAVGMLGIHARAASFCTVLTATYQPHSLPYLTSLRS